MAANRQNVEAHDEESEPQAPEDGLVSLKGTFVKEVAYMMYAFGDDDASLAETVDLMEDLVIEYASGILRKSLDLATVRSRSAVKAAVSDGDVLAVVRRDPKKYDRLLELQRLKEELENTRAIDGTGETHRELVVTKEPGRGG